MKALNFIAEGVITLLISPVLLAVALYVLIRAIVRRFSHKRTLADNGYTFETGV